MTLTPDRLSTPAEMPVIDPFWKDSQETPEEDLTACDTELIAELWNKVKEHNGYFSEATGLTFDNYEISQLAQKQYASDALKYMEDLLRQRETVHIPMLDNFSVTVDDKLRELLIVAATIIAKDTPNHGDMSSMLYLRDHIQAAAIFMALSLKDPIRYEKEMADGHALLLSALHLMSTPSQLDRFKDVIKRGDEAGQADWPHISLHFHDMDATAPDNKWRNKQDTFQMLAYTTLVAIDQGFIDVNELEPAHKEFLGSIVPLLSSVGFPEYENSGSWEELEARRTSVMSIETALLHKMKKMIESGADLGFLEDIYNKNKAYLPLDKAENFTDTLDAMINAGLRKIGQQLPFESPDYTKDSIKYREADAALAYVLMYDIPDLLADAKVPVGPDKQAMTRRQIENLVFEQLFSLFNSKTNGILRYFEDSYQRGGPTNTIKMITDTIKKEVARRAEFMGEEIDLDEKQRLRNERTPEEDEATWVHQLGQISEIAANRMLRAVERGELQEAEEYRELSTLCLNGLLSNITGEDQYHAVLGKNKRYEVRQVPPYKLPECKVTYRNSEGKRFTVPSSHTPLNWASATAMHAIGILRIAIEAFEQKWPNTPIS
jgi:hypothetical protein